MPITEAIAERKKTKTASLTDLIISRLKKVQPKASAECSYDVTHSSKIILSDVNYVLTTGIRAFDDLSGGLPFGRVVELFGLESCGKTAMAIRCAIRAKQGHVYKRIRNDDKTVTLERVDPDSYHMAVLYVDNEQSLDSSRKIMVDGTELDVVLTRCDTVELLFKEIDELIKTCEAYKEETGKEVFVVVVVDTIAGTSSKEELAQAWDKDDYPRQPKQLSQGFRTMINDISRHNVCMICTNQVRTNFAGANMQKNKTIVPQHTEFSTFGGKALSFYSSHRVFMHGFTSKYTLIKGAQFAAGFLVGFYILKNRLKKPKREGRMVLLFDEEGQGGLHDVLSLLETFIFLGFAEYDEGTKQIVFKFRKNGIPTTTFQDITPSLEEQDSQPLRGRKAYKDPRIDEKAEWPGFYLEHKPDLDALWDASVKYAMTIEGMDGKVVEASGMDETEED